LSSGRAGGETDWTLRPDEIGDLHVVPAAGSGDARLTIQLVAPNNAILADTATMLQVSPGATAALAAIAGETDPAELQDPDAPVEATAAIAAEDNPANPEATASLSEPVPLPTRRPVPSAPDSAANWVRPSAYVNLRDGPSSTARVVSVVAKGAKLRVVTRKRGWVQVADPATSQTGWIYSGHAETVP
jgi:uncharacterized protein YgiM (DUF1202 family)